MDLLVGWLVDLVLGPPLKHLRRRRADRRLSRGRVDCALKVIIGRGPTEYEPGLVVPVLGELHMILEASEIGGVGLFNPPGWLWSELILAGES